MLTKLAFLLFSTNDKIVNNIYSNKVKDIISINLHG